MNNNTRHDRKKRFRILSIDGGGVRGILPSVILSRLEELTGRHPADLFDLMIGTSTGSIIISVLNIPDEHGKPKFNCNDLLDIYLKECPKVFSASTWKNLTSMYGVYGGRFSTHLRDDLFNQWLGEVCLSGTVGDIVIPTFDLCSKQPVFFKTRKARMCAEDDICLQDVVKGALAAPTIFNPHQIQDRLYMDALYGKNPTMFGIIEALKHYDVSLNDIEVFSIGTGYSEDGNVETIQRTVQSGLSFLLESFNATINGNTKSVQYMSSQLLQNRPDQCMRVDFFLPDMHMGICDVTVPNLSFLYNEANNHFDKNMVRIIEFCKRIVPDSVDVDRLNVRLDQHLASLVPLPDDDLVDEE